jgi:hypothetical protein
MGPALELQQIQHGGIRFSFQPLDDRHVIVKLGDYRSAPLASAVVSTLEEAVFWLREQAKRQYPESAYAKRLLTHTEREGTLGGTPRPPQRPLLHPRV